MVDSIVRSCIISSKGGIPLDEINNDYKDLTGEDIPFKANGFDSLKQYLISIDGVSIVGDLVKATSARTAHLEELIRKQKIKRHRFVQRGMKAKRRNRTSNKENIPMHDHHGKFTGYARNCRQQRSDATFHPHYRRNDQQRFHHGQDQNYRLRNFHQMNYQIPHLFETYNSHFERPNYNANGNVYFEHTRSNSIPAYKCYGQNKRKHSMTYWSPEYTLYLITHLLLCSNMY